MFSAPRRPFWCFALVATATIWPASPRLVSAQALPADSAPADQAEFVLNGGARLRGVLVDQRATPSGTQLSIRSDSRTGAKIDLTLRADQVRGMDRVTPQRLDYETLRHRAPDTVEGQLALAKWCASQQLMDEQRTHLERVIELDPNQAEARSLLGYRRVGNRWLTRDDVMTERGMVLYRGSYLTPQELQLMEDDQKWKDAEKEWIRNLNLWHRALTGRNAQRAQDARDQIRKIDDPAAVNPLIRHLNDSQTRDEKRLFMDALARTRSGAAIGALEQLALFDDDTEVRESALRDLEGLRGLALQSLLVKELTNPDNEIINRAGDALRRLGDADAIPKLIDSLVTTHVTVIPGRDTGRMDLTFDQNGNIGNFGAGATGPTKIPHTYQNSRVLAALMTLSGGKNFQYNQSAWKDWYASTQRLVSGSLRRDN